MRTCTCMGPSGLVRQQIPTPAILLQHAHHTRRSRPVRLRSSTKDESNTARSIEGEQNKASNDRPNPQRLRLQKVERLGEEAWAGVAAVDRGQADQDSNLGRIALLAGGDLAALLLFAAIGRSNHGESLDLMSVASTASPFLIGWFCSAPLLGGYSKAAQGGNVGAAAAKAAASWAVAIPIALAIRTAQRGYLPDKSFVIVSFVATLVLLAGWRSALAAATPNTEEKRGQNGRARRRDTKGTPFEFIQLLTSLVKRW